MNGDASRKRPGDDEQSPEVADDDLAALQEAVLNAVLRGTALPGGTATISLPDLVFLPANEATPLARANLARPLLDAPPAVVRLLSSEPSSSEQAIGYLSFTAASHEDEHVRIGLEVWQGPGGSQRALPLGGVQLLFARDHGKWRLVEPPQAFAT